MALDQIRALAREELRIEQVLARESDITIGIEHHYGFELSIDGILNEIETGEIDYQSLAADFDEYTQPVVRLVDALLNDAVKRSASDIHFEPEQGFLRIRYRIDGVLRQIRACTRTTGPAMVVRLKVMSGMNIAETRAPQDGRISLTLSGHQVDFRVSSQPTTHGENIVLRILDRDKGIVPLEELGLHADDLKTLKLMLARPEGIILVTGPTGSGKTTTLYSILELHQHRGRQHHDPRGSGRVPDGDDPPDLGERGGEARLRLGHPLDDAPGPGRDPGGRDARPGDRRDGVPRGDDRPPGVLDAAHQLLHRRGAAPAWTWACCPTSWPATSSA